MERNELKGKQTPGKAVSEKVYGWGDDPVVNIPERGEPAAKTIMSRRYYTQYAKRTDAEGNTWEILSDKAALVAGNYVPSAEVKHQCRLEIQANAALYAEAHNAANETGMWPLDMVERIKELESALKIVQSAAKLEAAKPGPTFCEELRDALNMVDHVLSKRP